MDVQLYVYDLSQGLARQLSQQFLGTHIDAVYHTSIVLENIEYFFGQGIQTCYAGSTHHGRPIQVLSLGKTELPMEIVLEYLESLKQTYSAESYDLFLHNCNNFSNDFAMFLVGKGIPGHITSLPETVLNTPFGQMLRPQIDSAMRSVTQAPVAPPRPSASTDRITNGSNHGTKQQHPHSKLPLPRLHSEPLRPVSFSNIPALDKVTSKLGPLAADPTVTDLVSFIRTRHANPSVPANAALPSLPQFSAFLQTTLFAPSLTPIFPLIDLLRVALLDPRIALFFATETPSSTSNSTTLSVLLTHSSLKDTYSARLTATQALSNALAHPASARHILSSTALAPPLVALLTDALLDTERPNVRAAAAAVVLNAGVAAQRARRSAEKSEAGELPADAQIGLMAALVEALGLEKGGDEKGKEEREKCGRRALLALGWLVYLHADYERGEGEVKELLEALDARAKVLSAGEELGGREAEIAKEIGEKLL